MGRRLPDVLAAYRDVLARGDREEMQARCLGDRFFLLAVALNRRDARRQWILDRCDEVQKAPDGRLDLWARFHFKSSIITLAGVIQEILKNRELTVCILSHDRPTAKAFLKQIKREFEENSFLQELFPDVLWTDPRREAPQWSENEGLKLKRRSNPKEATLEAWGLVDSLPVAKHYGLRVYDDVVTRESVTSPAMIAKTTEAWEHSLALTTEGGRQWHVGTRYHFADTYFEIVRRGAVVPRVYPAEVGGKAVLLDPAELETIRRDMGPYTYASQFMLDPKSGDSIGFQPEWLRYYHGNVRGNTYVICDPANSKRKGSDFTVFAVLEACEDENLYLRDMIRDRLNLQERVEMAVMLHKQWKPLRFGWEEYGVMADIDALTMHQGAIGYRFPLTKLAGPLSKEERITRMVPVCARGGFWLPERLPRQCKYSGRLEDLVAVFRDEEFLGWPYTAHDDMLDALSRILDPEMGLVFPKSADSRRRQPQYATTAASNLY